MAKTPPFLDEIGADNLELQFDIDHVQRSGERIEGLLAENLPRIGNIQFADCLGRHKPGTGDVNFENLFELIDRLGYAGWIGAEYVPARGTEEGLGWLKTYGAQV